MVAIKLLKLLMFLVQPSKDGCINTNQMVRLSLCL